MEFKAQDLGEQLMSIYPYEMDLTKTLFPK